MIDDDRLRARLREPLEKTAAPQSDLPRVRRRARYLRARRLAAAMVAGVVLVAGVTVPLAILSTVHGAPGRHPIPGAGGGTAISVDGFELTVPPGWTWRTDPHGQTYAPVLYAASFPIPVKDGKVDLGAARDQMPADGILLVLLDYTSSCPCGHNFPAAQLPLRL